jgi:hypothetical protein
MGTKRERRWQVGVRFDPKTPTVVPLLRLRPNLYRYPAGLGKITIIKSRYRVEFGFLGLASTPVREISWPLRP